MTHLVPLLVVVFYLAALFAVTWWARRLNARGGGGSVGYLLAGRGLPTVVVASMLAGLAVGGASTIGVAERAYSAGLTAGALDFLHQIIERFRRTGQQRHLRPSRGQQLGRRAADALAGAAHQCVFAFQA